MMKSNVAAFDPFVFDTNRRIVFTYRLVTSKPSAVKCFYVKTNIFIPGSLIEIILGTRISFNAFSIILWKLRPCTKFWYSNRHHSLN